MPGLLGRIILAAPDSRLARKILDQLSIGRLRRPEVAGAGRLLPVSCFQALWGNQVLSAEAREGVKPSAAPAASQGNAPSAISDEVVDEITKRVLARLTDQARPTILDVAERLVREEIERIKQNP